MPVLFYSSHSIDYPLRSQKTSRTILVSPFVDWVEKFIPPRIQGLILGTMCLSTWNTFVTVTKNYAGLLKILEALEDTGPNRTIPVPADKPFMNAILRANMNRGKYNLTNRVQIRADEKRAVTPPRDGLTPFQSRCEVPWPPHNVVFGMAVTDVDDIATASAFAHKMRITLPALKIAMFQSENADVSNWEKVLPKKGTWIAIADYIWVNGNIDVNLVGTGALV